MAGRTHYTAEERAKAIQVMARSARENGENGEPGAPNYSACERELGVGRSTLRRWWSAHREGESHLRPTRGASLHLLPGGGGHGDDEGDPEAMWERRREELKHRTPVEHWAWVYESTVTTVEAARLEGVYSAIPAMLSRANEAHAQMLAEMEEERKKRPTSRAEQLNRAAQTAERLPREVLARMNEVYERKFGAGG